MTVRIDENVNAALSGTVGITPFPAAAAAADGVSIAEVIRYIQETQIGTVNGATTDTLQGKLGTDTELADRSLYDILNGDGPVTADASAAPGDNVSLYGAVRYTAENLIALLNGTGPAAAAAAAAPGNNVPLYAAVRHIVEVLLGTFVDTGAADDTLATIVGDLANDSLVARLNDIGSDPDSVVTSDIQGKIGTDTEMADRSLYDLLNGDGPVTADASAAPGDNVSLYGAVRYTAENLIALLNGTGPAAAAAAAAPGNNVPIYAAVRHIVEVLLGTFVNTGAADDTLATALGDLANDSLVARLNDIGTDVDSATTDNIQGKLGTDAELADRSLYDILNGAGPAAVAAAAAPANDVSIYGALRAIYNRQLGDVAGVNANTRLGKKVTKAAADIFDGTQKVLFTVAGGRILLTQINVEVTVANIDAGASNASLVSNPTVGTDMALCAVLDINGDELGTIYSITGNVADALTGGSGGGAMAQDRPIIIPEGTIDLLTVADVGTGGALGAAEAWYIPLDDGATLA